jgi:hypothetical protein
VEISLRLYPRLRVRCAARAEWADCLEVRLRLIVEVEPFKAAERLTRFSMGQHGTTGGAQAITRHAGSP